MGSSSHKVAHCKETVLNGYLNLRCLRKFGPAFQTYGYTRKRFFLTFDLLVFFKENKKLKPNQPLLLLHISGVVRF